VSDASSPTGVKPEPYVRPLSAESSGAAPGRGRLNGRRVLVVGGGQRTFDAVTDPIGNGRAMSLLFAREGAEVAVADLNLASAEDTVGRIKAEGGRAFAIAADVTREADVRRMIDEARRTMGGLDGMVLNVGTFGKTGLDGVSAEEWNKIYDVNVRGPMLACREALPKFENGGSIVFISSIAALRAGSQMPVYDSSKAALGGLMRNIAHVVARRCIRVNMVYPGLVDTPNGRTAGAGRPSRGKGHVPFGRQATAWEVAYAVLFFMSEESVYVTAQTLAVDSGLSGM
jgi:NAD(P)-dependent dehydrogenase (short-subunit alcohol dehydrogenase family)